MAIAASLDTSLVSLSSNMRSLCLLAIRFDSLSHRADQLKPKKLSSSYFWAWARANLSWLSGPISSLQPNPTFDTLADSPSDVSLDLLY